MDQTLPTVNRKRLLERMDKINRIGALEGGGVCRLALGEEDGAARDLLAGWMDDLGLRVEVDRIGNMFGILGDGNRFVGAGSHLDTVPTGGLFDGTLGVLAALEAAETIRERDLELPFSLVVANFTNEEGVRFQPDMMGSLAFAKPERLEKLLEVEDEEGVSVASALRQIGYDGEMEPGALPFEQFLELHIEQGPVLERESADIGVVTGVQCIHWERLTLTGRNSHAGTTPMELRRDPFHAFSRLFAHLNKVRGQYGNQLITAGTLRLQPGAINVIPETVTATLDIRNPDEEQLGAFLSELGDFAGSDASFEGIGLERETLVHIPPVTFDGELVVAVRQSAGAHSCSWRKMVSGAGHDAQLLSRSCPSAMIFIPSRDGVSHAVDEYSSPQQVENGANVLLNSILSLAG